MRKSNGCLLCLGFIILVGCHGNQRMIDEAKYNFNMHSELFEELLVYYENHFGLDYIEFCPNNLIDLDVVDKDLFNPDSSSFLRLKYEFHDKPLDSNEVLAAFQACDISLGVVDTLKKKLDSINCISIQKSFWNHDRVKYEIGYKRYSMSKWVYLKLKEDTSSELYVRSQWKRKRKNFVRINDSWVLTLASPAFN
ncbi:hypothetical protein KAR48_15130 [bacterium]|nr:hypothetical protein [bacterium]